MAKSFETMSAQGTSSGDLTASQIIAPGDNFLSGPKQRVVIDKISLSLTATGTVTVVNAVSTSINILPKHAIAAGNQFILDSLKRAKSEPGEGVALTSTGSGNVAWYVEYHYEP